MTEIATRKEEEELDFENYIMEQPFVSAVRNWTDYELEALAFLREGKHTELREMTDFFFKHRPESSDQGKKEIDRRKKLLRFIYKSDFTKKPIEKQEELIKEACGKEREYWRLSQRFSKEIERAKTRAEILSIGRRCDEIARKRGLDIFQGDRNFLFWAQERTREVSPTPVIRAKPRKQRQFEKHMANTISPSSYNYLKLKHKNGEGCIKFERREVKEGEEREVTFEVKHLSDRCETVLDFLFDRKAKRNGAELLKKRPDTTDIIPFEEFETALERSEAQRNILRSVSFTSMELRKQLGIRITDREIRSAVQELIDTKIELEGVKIWCEKNGGEKRYRKVTLIDRIAYNAAIQETGRVEPRTKAKQHRFTVTLGSGWEMIFHNDILNRRYACFPKEFYRASKGARALGRYLSCWGKGVITIGQATEILGYEKQTVNLTRRKQLIEKKLDELKRLDIIKSWKRMKKNGKEITGKQTAWRYKRV